MSKRYRVAILLADMKGIVSENFDTIDEAETYVLSCAEKNKVKQYRILDRETKQIVGKGVM